jgi:histidinol-phosphate/aromatic aminotransferase/cobyric acid decarboxylase-like protein
VLLERLVARTGNVALVDRYRTGMDGTVVAVADGLVTHVFPPHLQGPDFAYGDKLKTLNIYRFDADFCRRTLRPLLHVYANQIDANCYYELVLGMLANIPAHRIAAEVVDGDLWTEVDDPNDLAVARFKFEPERRAELLDRTFGGQWGLDVRDFSFMRNVHFPTEAMTAALRHALPELLAGYGSTQTVLNEKLALVVGCPAERLQALHGATQAFPILRELFAGRRVAIPEPTFGEFPRMFPDAERYRDAPGIAFADLEDAARRVDVVVAVNPNNPTGTTLPTAALHDLARRHPGTTFLVDESFADFSGEEPLIALLEREPLANVVVLVSLSKTLGVPGLRLGYLYAHDAALLAAVGERLPIWNLGAAAEYFLELVPKFRPELELSIARTVADREELRAALEGIAGVAEVHPSGGDFLLARLAGPAELGARIREELLATETIDVKDVSGRFPDGEPRLRIGVRGPDENHAFAAALAGALERLAR